MVPENRDTNWRLVDLTRVLQNAFKIVLFYTLLTVKQLRDQLGRKKKNGIKTQFKRQTPLWTELGLSSKLMAIKWFCHTKW